MPSARPMPSATADLFDPPPPRVTRPRARRDALPWPYVLIAAAGVAILLWAAWVTEAVLGQDRDRPVFAAIRLQPLVAEHVQAQVRMQSSEEQVTRETRAFMARLDAELARRGKAGTTILVAEAVLSKDVPDITDDVRRALQAAAAPPATAQGGERAPGR